MSDVSMLWLMQNTLRVRRAERRLSQRRVAHETGIGFDRYWRIENDYTTPTAEERTALAAVFGVSEDVVFPAATEQRAEVA